ncbi:DUF5818 domain-containing protein [Sphingobium sp. RAC03]|jgi:hypothetical protein|uniref:DUF5818 domain-containing protein n=1 Tax=Sphingobium sp. RAC03 TaxID=1843368 RepID=UPI00083D7D3B|nr:DUF5818 domain-containing protein [Sphingobium sp. RAC03]AOF98563.1 hypothetical protein BSY17_3990 [Sphingobium sp. RAC03]
MTGKTLRVAGVIQPSPRGPVLRVADGTRWRLIAGDTIDHMLGRCITVEGIRQGGAIDAYYLAPVSEASRC